MEKNSYILHFDDGQRIASCANGTRQEIESYFAKMFLGRAVVYRECEETGREFRHTAIRISFEGAKQ